MKPGEENFPRNRIAPNHAIFCRQIMLYDTDILIEGDETACISTLLNFDSRFHEGWQKVTKEDFKLGKTIRENLEDDIDAQERIFRRIRTKDNT